MAVVINSNSSFSLKMIEMKTISSLVKDSHPGHILIAIFHRVHADKKTFKPHNIHFIINLSYHGGHLGFHGKRLQVK